MLAIYAILQYIGQRGVTVYFYKVFGDTSKPTGTPTLFCVHIRKQQRMFDLRIA